MEWIEEQNPEPDVPIRMMKLQICTVVRPSDLLSGYVEGIEAVQQDAMRKLNQIAEREIFQTGRSNSRHMWPAYFVSR